MDFIGRVLAVLGRGLLSLTFGVIVVCVPLLIVGALLALYDGLAGVPHPGTFIGWSLPGWLFLVAVLIGSAVGYRMSVNDARGRERDLDRVVELGRVYYAEEARRQSLWTDIRSYLALKRKV